MGYSPWGRKESGMTERLTLTYLSKSKELEETNVLSCYHLGQSTVLL